MQGYLTMSVNIHGNEYVTVAERLQEAREHLKSINTEVLPHATKVVIKATVVTDKGTFTGISAANPEKVIEKMSPFEVAETSAVGRALGFAGFGAIDSIATADEIKKAEVSDPTSDWKKSSEIMPKCTICGDELTAKETTRWTSYEAKRGLKPKCYQCAMKEKQANVDQVL